MKNFIKILIVLLICSLLGLWSPWLKINVSLADIFGVEEPDKISGLQVYSFSGEMEVFLDGESQGTVTPESSPFIVDAVTPGEKSVGLKRVTEIPGAYWEFSKVITFEENIDVVLSYILGPEEEFSEGNIVSTVARTDEDYNLKVNLNVEGVELYLDNIEYIVDGTEFRETISLDKQHTIKITKQGMEEIEFLILPEDQQSRDQFANYIINVDVQLMYQPVSIL